MLGCARGRLVGVALLGIVLTGCEGVREHVPLVGGDDECEEATEVAAQFGFEALASEQELEELKPGMVAYRSAERDMARKMIRWAAVVEQHPDCFSVERRADAAASGRYWESRLDASWEFP